MGVVIGVSVVCVCGWLLNACLVDSTSLVMCSLCAGIVIVLCCCRVCDCVCFDRLL